MRLFITGAAITLVFSMVAFILSFQACNSITKPTDTGISDVIEAEDIGGDTINDIKPTDEETNGMINKRDKVEMIFFDIDGKVVERKFVDNI